MQLDSVKHRFSKLEAFVPNWSELSRPTETWQAVPEGISGRRTIDALRPIRTATRSHVERSNAIERRDTDFSALSLSDRRKNETFRRIKTEKESSKHEKNPANAVSRDLLEDISKFRTNYLAKGGMNPDVLSQLSRLEKEALALDTNVKSYPSVRSLVVILYGPICI